MINLNHFEFIILIAEIFLESKNQLKFLSCSNGIDGNFRDFLYCVQKVFFFLRINNKF